MKKEWNVDRLGLGCFLSLIACGTCGFGFGNIFGDRIASNGAESCRYSQDALAFAIGPLGFEAMLGALGAWLGKLSVRPEYRDPIPAALRSIGHASIVVFPFAALGAVTRLVPKRQIPQVCVPDSRIACLIAFSSLLIQSMILYTCVIRPILAHRANSKPN